MAVTFLKSEATAKQQQISDPKKSGQTQCLLRKRFDVTESGGVFSPVAGLSGLANVECRKIQISPNLSSGFPLIVLIEKH